MKRGTRPMRRIAVVWLTAMATMAGGCDGELAAEFRSAAGDKLQEGLMTIMDGVLEGAFAVFTPDDLADKM